LTTTTKKGIKCTRSLNLWLNNQCIYSACQANFFRFSTTPLSSDDLSRSISFSTSFDYPRKVNFWELTTLLEYGHDAPESSNKSMAFRRCSCRSGHTVNRRHPNIPYGSSAESSGFPGLSSTGYQRRLANAAASGATSNAASAKFNAGSRFYNAYQVSSNFYCILLAV
jgi:hypothetical protein